MRAEELRLSIKDYSDDELKIELSRRHCAREVARCDVCDAMYDDPTCGSPRHSMASESWYRRWQFEYGSSFLIAHPLGCVTQAATRNWDRTSLHVSRYGVRVTLFGENGRQAAETSLPVDFTDDHPRSNMSDEDRLHWAIDWAIGVLAESAARGDG